MRYQGPHEIISVTGCVSIFIALAIVSQASITMLSVIVTNYVKIIVMLLLVQT